MLRFLKCPLAIERVVKASFVVGLSTALFFSHSAWAKSISLIRDAEIEHTIRTFATPIFKAAKLDPEKVGLYIVNDSSLNAFVAGGDNIFLNVGLLMQARTPNQLIGVIAHETGHITGRHLARLDDALKGASAQSILATILGVAAIAAGAGDAGAAIIYGGQSLAQQKFLRHSRGEESSADQAAYKFLTTSKQSPAGMLRILEFIQQENGRTPDDLAYLLTHPIYRERIAVVRHMLEVSPYADAKDPVSWQIALQRMRAKLEGFLLPAGTMIKRYQGRRDLTARYARAIALYRAQRPADALGEIDNLLEDFPNDPYFLELAGQILFENGKIEHSIGFYQRAVDAQPNSALLLEGLTQAMLATEDPAYLPGALQNAKISTRLAPRDPLAWRQLAEAFGGLGNIGRAALATAERYMLISRFEQARRQAKRSLKLLPVGATGHLRAADIITTAKRQIKKSRNR